ncbi:ferritin-like domain-containing protein [Edaphobacillus lindanitolerans]|uniref:Rubrerythrin n=1 Tax=Edaphobacillus lindanitolerans TaxID=550447 RepID=A0A1U7PSQ4_9BACI|nr:ferritin-like domain-containing protein [Edaphobacillus lindanitolerans]SIT90818.1 Rubrerythrin [Edaphobacillus lindanitolerans]
MFTDQLREAIEEEYKAYHFYKSMASLTKDPYWLDFIHHAMEDEKSHYEMFQQLYYMLTGSFVQSLRKPGPCDSLKSCAKKAVRDELEAAELYKVMLLEIPIPEAYNPLFLAMHDETEHAIRFSMMYNAL